MADTHDLISQQIEAYEAQLPELKQHHDGKFVVFHERRLAGVYDTLDAAAKEALSRFPPGSFLIRQVGRDSNVPMPASLMFGSAEHAAA